MTRLTDRLKELLAPDRSGESWCDTTRLANPWAVLHQGLRRAGDTARDTEPAQRDAGSAGAGIPDTDLRQTGTARAEEGERR